MGAALGIIAILVAVASAVFAYQARRAAERSANAAEAADRREREPRLTIMLDCPTPAPGDRVIYRLRNDGPQDLTRVVIHRPRPPDRIVYNVAVTGSDWADDEIDLGPLAITEEARFTLSCGVAPELPEFWVRIECQGGGDRWPLSRRLPAPRGEPLGEAEKATRHAILSAAQEEIERNIRGAQGDTWYAVLLEDDRLKAAHRLLHEHAPDWIGPVRDAVDGVRDWNIWAERSGGSSAGDELQKRRDAVVGRLSGAHSEIENMRAALTSRQASGRAWKS